MKEPLPNGNLYRVDSVYLHATGPPRCAPLKSEEEQTSGVSTSSAGPDFIIIID